MSMSGHTVQIHSAYWRALRTNAWCSALNVLLGFMLALSPVAFADDMNSSNNGREASPEALMLSAKELFAAGDFESSEEALRVAIAKVDTGSLRYAVCLQNLALIEYLNFHFIEAQKLYESALSITESACGKDSLPVANNLYGLSRCLRRSKQSDEAERCLHRLLELRIKLLGNEHRLVGNTSLDIAVNYERQGKFEQANAFYAKALEIREKDYGKTSICLKYVLETYAQCLRKAKDDNKANELDERVKGLTQTSNASLPSSGGEEDGSNWQSTIYSKQ